MASSATETVIGAVVLAVAGGFLVYAANTADVAAGGGYPVLAKFRKAEGLNVGGDVRIAGVKVGTVSGMELDPTTYNAVLTLSVRSGIELPDDSSAKIASASLLGDSYVAIEPGGSEYMIEPGGEITYTQGSFSIGDAIGRFIHGGSGGGDGGEE